MKIFNLTFDVLDFTKIKRMVYRQENLQKTLTLLG